jgi:hypothetical protein
MFSGSLCLKEKNESDMTRFLEASTGFEPVIRVLQTLALPLGHDAIKQLLIVDRRLPIDSATRNLQSAISNP